MYSNREFHESYFHHTCLIIPEKDVLDTDLDGTGCATRIMRWWNDLFLLSYTCERSRGFYTSSHAMRIERFRQFRKYKHRIHPMSKFSNFWDFLILHVLIMNKILFRLTSTFIFDDLPMYFFYLGALFELIIIADLYVNLKTGYMDIEAKRVVLDTKKCLVNFCTKKLFIHYASAIPMHWMMFLRYGANINCGLCKANRFTCALKIISIFSLFRIFETSAYWTRKRHSNRKIHFLKFLRIGVISIVTMCQFYDLSDVIVLLMFIYNGTVVKESILGLRAAYRYIYKNIENKQLTNNYIYVFYDISRIFQALQLDSHGMQESIYYLDELTSLAGLAIAKTFHLWSLLECYAIISRIAYPMDSVLKMRDHALNLVKCRQLSNELKYKVDQYFEFKPTKLRLIERKNELYRILPEVLKQEITLSCYIKLIMRIPFFTDFPLPVLEQIVLVMKKELFLKNDIVAEAWVQGDGLMIVDDGMLAVYSQFYEEQGHLIDGDYFGELSLVTDKELCMSFVVAITPCTILLLDKIGFRDIMRKYPKLFLEMKKKMSELYQRNKLVTSRRESDLQSTEKRVD